MKDAFKTAWIRRFGGVCQNAIPDAIPLGMFADALNYELTDKGSIHPRLGYKLYAQAGTPDGKPVRTIFAADMDGELRLLVATSHNVYEFIKSSDSWSHVYSIVNTSANRMTFGLLNAATAPLVVFGNGADPLKKWNGATVSNCSGAPAGRPVSFKNYVALFDIPNFPGRVQFSIEHGDPDNWSYGGKIKSLEMRGRVTSIYPYGGGLVVFTETRTEMFVGDPDYAQSMNILSETLGCSSHETVCDCNGRLVWLSQAGVVFWNGSAMFPSEKLSDPELIDGSVRSTIKRDLDRIAWDQRSLISAFFDPTRQKYHLTAKLQSISESQAYWRTFVYDFKHGGWFPWDLECTAAESIIDASKRQISILGTYEGALLTRSADIFHDEGLTSNREYEYWARSGDFAFDSADYEKLLRAVSITLGSDVEDTAPGDRILSLTLRGEFDRYGTDTFEFINSAGGFKLGFNVLGDRLNKGSRYGLFRAPVAIRAIWFNWRITGKGRGNAANMTAIGFTYRITTKRPIMCAA